MSDGNEANDQFAFFQPTTYGAEVAGRHLQLSGAPTLSSTPGPLWTPRSISTERARW